MKKSQEKKLEKLGSFAIAFKMLSLAKNNEKQNIFLNAGRGNPNWINTISRAAFARLIQFGIKDSKQTINKFQMAGYMNKSGIYERLESFLDPNQNEEDKFILDFINYSVENFNFVKDDFVKELIDGVIGNNYPIPSRVLHYTEIVLNSYLSSVLYNNCSDSNLSKETKLFPTEGGTAAITYIFHSLKENNLIHPGDKIALNTPIFTPYIDIPELKEYDIQEVDLRSEESNNWKLKSKTIEQLKDTNLKALFLVNPSNPASVSLSDEALSAIQNAIKFNPNLMIITDDVYGTFVSNFRSVYSVVPYNTLLVYSFSKLEGATGWRLGVIAMHNHNVFDDLISNFSQDLKSELNKRYGSVVLEPSKMKFIDRIVADSRSVGLYHTAGLSTPQQILELLFSMAHLLNINFNKKKIDRYIEEARSIVKKRYDDLHEGLKIKEFNSNLNSRYYSLIDIYDIAKQYYGQKFSEWLRDNFEEVDFLVKLSQMNGVVLIDGVGFGTKPGVLRVSEANLPTEDYALIAHQILDLMSQYYNQYKKQNKYN